MLRRFVKREVLKDISPLQLVKLDVSEKNNWVPPKDVNIGLGAESVLKVVFHLKYNHDGYDRYSFLS